MSRLLTVLEANVPVERHPDLERAYRTAIAEEAPPGLIRSTLLRDVRDPTLWRIETLWESRETLAAMRSSGVPPRGILIFRQAGAEPVTSILEVVEELRPDR